MPVGVGGERPAHPTLVAGKRRAIATHVAMYGLVNVLEQELGQTDDDPTRRRLPAALSALARTAGLLK